MRESYPNGLKTLWEKEKLLVTSNFSFSHSVFKRLVSQGRQKVSLCGNGLKRIRIYPLPHHPDLITTLLWKVPGRFAPKPFPPLVVSPPSRFPPGRFPPGRFAPLSRFVPPVVSSLVVSPQNNLKLNCTNELHFYEL